MIERLRATHGEMAEAFDSSGMWTRLPFRFWLRSAAASLFTHEPLLRFVGELDDFALFLDGNLR